MIHLLRNTIPADARLVKEKEDVKILWSAMMQMYSVVKSNKVISIGYKYSDVKTYVL